MELRCGAADGCDMRVQIKTLQDRKKKLEGEVLNLRSKVEVRQKERRKPDDLCPLPSLVSLLSSFLSLFPLFSCPPLSLSSDRLLSSAFAHQMVEKREAERRQVMEKRQREEVEFLRQQGKHLDMFLGQMGKR